MIRDYISRRHVLKGWTGFLISDLPFIAFFHANQKQEVNKSSTFGLTCIVDNSKFSNMSMKNKGTGKDIRTGILTGNLTFTETSAKCYQTAEYICAAKTLLAASSQLRPRSLWIFSILFCSILFYNLQTNGKMFFWIGKTHCYIITTQFVAINTYIYMYEDKHVFPKTKKLLDVN